jgi:hypothetical protein
MNFVTLDFETYWDSDYTLSKMTTEEYVRDPRFKAHMVGVKVRDKPTVIIRGDQISAAFSKINWGNTAVLAQHAHFDGFILSYHYGVKPAFWFDTLSMFRAIHPTESASLANQARVLGLPEKGAGYNIVNTRGMETLSPQDYRACAEYCKLDCDITKLAFNELKPHFPASELRLIDLTVRMFTEPILELDSDLLLESWDDERKATLALFKKAMPHLADEAGAAIINDDVAAWKKLKTPLASNPQFAAMLYDFGIDPPKKISPSMLKRGDITPETAGLAPEGLLEKVNKKNAALYVEENGVPHPSVVWTYAFGKSDEAFKRFLLSDNQDLVALVEARLGVKSTIRGTRAQRMIGIAGRGALPIYLVYYSAHTGRYGGGGRINPQNLNKFCPSCGGSGKL